MLSRSQTAYREGVAAGLPIQPYSYLVLRWPSSVLGSFGHVNSLIRTCYVLGKRTPHAVGVAGYLGGGDLSGVLPRTPKNLNSIRE